MDVYSKAAARLESPPPGEDDQVRQISELIVELLDRRYTGGAPILRAVHPKAHACVDALFEVNCDLAEHLRVGVFATPGASFEAVVRFSNAAALVGPDVSDVLAPGGAKQRAHGSRGMAVKVRGLLGKALTPDDEPGTQDFLMVNFPVFPFANVADYLELTKAQRDHKDDPGASRAAFAKAVAKDAAGAQRVKRAQEIGGAIASIPVPSPLQSPYFSAAPSLFGADHVMKFAAMPVDSTVDPLPETLSESYLREILVEQLRDKGAVFDFCVQLRASTEQLDIEDVSVEWKREATPWQKVAQISIRAQDFSSSEALAACEALFFTPWHTLPEHRPLGGINRLRRAAYLASFNRRRRSPAPASKGG